MMRQSSGRNQRSRGWKVKHVLQICVLLAVCVWLLYQVKHSHDKKKALDERSLKLSEREEERRIDFLKLGRKDPQGSTVLIARDDPVQNDEEIEEAAEVVNKLEENEEEGRMAGGGEIEENDRERADEEAEGVEEFGDEEDKEERLGNADLSDGQVHESDDEKSQEAREEHYNTDDALRAIVRDTQKVDQGSENLGTEHSDDRKANIEKEELENDSRTNGTEDVSKDGELQDVLVNDEGQLNNSESLREEAATTERVPEVDLSNSTVLLESAGHIEESGNTASDYNNQMEQQNDSTYLQHDNQIEQPNNSAVLIDQMEQGDSAISEPNDETEQNISTGTDDQIEQHDNSTISDTSEQIEQQNNLTGTNQDVLVETQTWSEGANAETVDSTHKGATVNTDSASQDQNTLDEARTLGEDNTSSENMSLEQTERSDPTGGVEASDKSHKGPPVSDENGDSVQGDSTNSSSNVVPNIRKEEQDAQTDMPPEQTEKSDQTGVEASDENHKTSSVSDENGDSFQEDSTNSSSNVVPTITEEQDTRTDLSTLPEVGTISVEGIAAE